MCQSTGTKTLSYKKRDKIEYDDYKSISLFNFTHKMFSRILLKCLTTWEITIDYIKCTFCAKLCTKCTYNYTYCCYQRIIFNNPICDLITAICFGLYDIKPDIIIMIEYVNKYITK